LSIIIAILLQANYRGLAYSFILDISIAPLKVHYYSEALPTTPLILYSDNSTVIIM